LAVLLSADVLLVKHFFSPRIAGQYGAVAALGRAIFWGSTGVATVLFPKVVFSEARGGRSTSLVMFSLGLVSTGGVVGLFLLTVYSKPILTLFAGPAYGGGAAYLPWYALGMSLLGAVSVLVSAHQSRGNATFLWALLPASVLEPALIVQFHRDPMQVVVLLNVCAGLLVAALLAAYARDEYGPRVFAARRKTPAEMGQKDSSIAPLSASLVGIKPQ
jgi:O-antigen/teichoic acid export membrane protein